MGKFWGLFLENLEGRGRGHTANPSVGVVWKFLEPHNVHQKRYYGFVPQQWCASLF